jgi:hypothetical protein
LSIGLYQVVVCTKNSHIILIFYLLWSLLLFLLWFYDKIVGDCHASLAMTEFFDVAFELGFYTPLRPSQEGISSSFVDWELA